VLPHGQKVKPPLLSGERAGGKRVNGYGVGRAPPARPSAFLLLLLLQGGLEMVRNMAYGRRLNDKVILYGLSVLVLLLGIFLGIRPVLPHGQRAAAELTDRSGGKLSGADEVNYLLPRGSCLTTVDKEEL
jgi:hypothetical protein